MRIAFLVAAIEMVLLATSGSHAQDVRPAEKCFYYRIAVATVGTQQQSMDQLVLTVVEVYRQGEKCRVVGEHGETWLTDGETSVFFHRDARKGWVYPSLPDGLVLSQLGGIAFPISFLVTERVSFPMKALRSEEVGSSICTVWDTDTLWPLIGVSNGSKGRMTIWVPREKGTIPIGFQRLRLSIENKMVIEARLIEAKEVPSSTSLFNVDKDIALVTISSREDLFKMVNSQLSQSKD
ncbi:MAG: hypothetical protein KatS3mg023_3317 [Armatimonadota bacterium]|nr:MAG: hypothetical protein KatS3mg023_3317 [Armatimonadota bacterium]